MAISVLQQNVNAPGTTQFPTIAFGSNVTKGSLLCVHVSWSASTGSITSVTDTVGTVYTPVYNILQGAARSLRSYVGYAPASGPNTVQFSLSASEGSTACGYQEISAGSIATDATPITVTVSTASTTATVGPIAPGNINDICIAVLRGGTVSAGTASWTSIFTGSLSIEYIIPGNVTARSATWTQASATYIAALMVFRSGQPVSLNGVASSEADGTPAITAGSVSIVLSGLGSGEADGSPNVSTAITLSGLSSSEADGAPNVTAGPIGVALSGLGSQEGDGTPSVNPGVINLSLTGYPSHELDGTPNVTLTPFPIGLIGLASGEADGIPAVASGAVSVFLAAIGSTEADGTPAISPGGATIVLTGLGSIELDGTPRVTQPGFIYLSGLASTESDGAPEVSIEPPKQIPFTPNVVNGRLIAKTIQSQGGDFWDSISKREYKTEKLFNILAAANPMLSSYAELPAGSTINVPFIDVASPSISTLPWSKLIQYG